MSNSRNTSIPREYISGAAGMNDKFSIEVVDTATYFKDTDREKLPYNVISNKYKREILSTDLDQGMTIQAVVTKNRIKAGEKLKAIKESTDLEQDIITIKAEKNKKSDEGKDK